MTDSAPTAAINKRTRSRSLIPTNDLKRPPSPAKDAALFSQHDPKRSRVFPSGSNTSYRREVESARPELHPARCPPQLNASLSELTDALARLNEPAPARPHTSMGFYRSLQGKGTTATMTGGQKKMKQAKLMLPPPVPTHGTRTRTRTGRLTDIIEGEETAEGMTTKDKIGAWLQNASEDVLKDLGHTSEDTGTDDKRSGTGPTAMATNGDLNDSASKERENEKEARRNASRRASMARHFLTQSLSALPDTPPRDVDGADAKGKGRAASSSWPASAGSSSSDADVLASVIGEGEQAEDISAPSPAPRAHNTRLATGALSTPPNVYKEQTLRSSGGSDEGKGKGKAEESPGVLAVLRDCRVFVDVKTDEGEDAGALFVDMLRDLGAKLATRVGSRCTHVVFKNGLMSTLTRYRSLNDPKPLVVGIAWVVECAEQRRKVDETRFLQNLDLENVAGVNKRRKSMAPKHYSPFASKIAVSPASSDSSRTDTVLTMGIGAGGNARFPAQGIRADRSMELSSPLTADDDGDRSVHMLSTTAAAGGSGPDTAAGATDDADGLTPLERARRRRSMLPRSMLPRSTLPSR